MRQSHLLMYNAAVIWLMRALRIIPELILVPFLIRSIGESGFGLYALAWSLMVSIEMLDMGLQSGIIKHCAALVAQKRIPEVNKVISTAFVQSAIFAVIAGGATIVAGGLLHERVAGLAFALVTIGTMVLLAIPLSPYVGVVLSQQRHYINAIVDTTSKYISLVAVIIWYKLVGPSVESLIVISAAAVILTRVLQIPVAYWLIPDLQNRPGSFEWWTFKMLMSFGVMTFLCTLCSIMHSTGVRWLMGYLVSTSFVAHLAIICMPGRLLSQIVKAMTWAVMPTASKYDAVEDYRMLQELLIRGVRYSFLGVMAGVIVAVLTMRSVLVAWLGPEYAFLAIYALVVFCSVALQMSSSCAHHILRGMGRLNTSLVVSIVGHVIVPMAMILGIWAVLRQPYVAAAVGIASGNAMCGLLQTIFCTHAVKLTAGELFVRAYGGPMILSISVFLLAFGSVAYVGMESLEGRVLAAALAVLLFCCGFGVFLSTASERGQLWEACRCVLGRR